MKRFCLLATVGALVAAHGSLAHAQATLSLNDGVLRIPSLTVGADVYTNVVLRYGADGRFGLEAATPPAAPQPPAGGAQTLQLNYAPQPNTQYWYNAQGRVVATCSNLAQAAITLKVPAGASAQAKVPLVISLAGWAPSGNPPAPVPQDPAGLDQFGAAGLASATFEYRGCDNWSSPLIARTNVDETFDIASSDFGLGLAAIKAAIAARNLPIDTSRIVVAGTSFSSNLIFTVATKHRLQGAIALAGGCDYDCNATGTTYEQPNDFRVNGAPIRVAAISGAGDTLFPPLGLGSSGYGASGARARILTAIPDAGRRPAAFYTHVAAGAGHEVNATMWAKARTFAQCMTGARPAADCTADDR
ncbi:MAG: hypothetical protein V4679_07955 [Pseudomonadota bacterium]